MRRLGLASLVFAGGLCGAIDDLAAQQDSTVTPRVAWTTITYLSGATVYLEVGRIQGVREGTTFTVVRADSAVAELAATYVSSSRTAARVVAGETRLQVGDSVRFVPVIEQAPVTVAPGGRRLASAATRRGPPPVRGRVGVRYLVIDQGNGRLLRQPSLDLRLDGNQIGGSPIGLAVDVRMQRTRVTSPSGEEMVPAGQTRVYQAALVHQRTRGGSRIALGRQFATTLSPLGIFDGLAIDLHGSHWSGGVLAGTQPDMATFAPSGERTEYGAWIQRHGARGTSTPYAAQEIDANRGWKREVAPSFATFTATLLTAQLSVSDALQFSGGLDSRRTIPLYRDFINPEIAFDDALRQGQWGDVTVRPNRHLRLSAGVRRSDGSNAGTAQSATASLTITRLTGLGLGLRARTTRFTGPLSEGQLSSAALELAPGNRWRFSVNAGLRTSGPPGASATTRLTWIGGDLDLSINRSLYLLLSTYRESGQPSPSIQSYGSLSWPF